VTSRIHLPFKLGVRGKLIIISTIIFTLIFTVHGFLTGFALTQASSDLELTVLHQNIQDVLTLLSQTISAPDVQATITSQDDSTDAYQRIISPLEDIVDINPQVDQVYVYAYDSASQQITQLAIVCSPRTEVTDCDGQSELTLDDPVSVEDWQKPIIAKFSEEVLKPDVYLDPQIWDDGAGIYTSGYAPIRNTNHQVIAFMGVDMRAKQLGDIIAVGRDTSIKGFVLIYPFALIFMVLGASAVTSPLRKFARAARMIERGEPYDPDIVEKEVKLNDERGELARTFDRMARQVESRQKKLQQEVVQLKIEIDRSRQQQAVEEITETDFFSELQAKAKTLRDQERTAEGTSSSEPSDSTLES